MKIQKGDTVIIKSGKDRGKTGKVLSVLSVRNAVIVEGLNLYKKHQKARGQGQKGGIIQKPMPVHASNVMILDGKTKRGARVGYDISGDRKARILRAGGKSSRLLK